MCELYAMQMFAQGRYDRIRQDRVAILGAFPIAHGDLLEGKVDVFDAEPQRFEQTEAAAVE